MSHRVNAPPHLARWRRFAGALLAAAIFAAAPAPHDHSLFESERSAPEAVTSHNPLSAASHWHAVRGFLRPEICLACHGHRLPGLPVLAQATWMAIWAVALELPTRFDVPRRSLGTRLSRAPPGLL
jgi:cytochrome c5